MLKSFVETLFLPLHVQFSIIYCTALYLKQIFLFLGVLDTEFS